MTQQTENSKDDDKDISYEQAWASDADGDPTPLKDAVREAHEQAVRSEQAEYLAAYRDEKPAGEGEKA